MLERDKKFNLLFIAANFRKAKHLNLSVLPIVEKPSVLDPGCDLLASPTTGQSGWIEVAFGLGSTSAVSVIPLYFGSDIVIAIQTKELVKWVRPVTDMMFLRLTFHVTIISPIPLSFCINYPAFAFGIIYLYSSHILSFQFNAYIQTFFKKLTTNFHKILSSSSLKISL